MLREDRGRLTEEISVDLIDVHGEDLSPAAENADGAAGHLPPVGRFGTPEDCAAAVAYMAADEAGYMTGETVLVTGGIQARL